ncbi:glycosyltransferase family 2 protein [Methylovulum psychrotolerans]|uniref:Glycosyltransferase family 2 protein n=2 Tax=Methylovulum psychrotolerans TaxID=1704499 RepID=A0A2S5CMR3_9GAMM|nr:glycosyltransferase family 2 protein [Methylovulum psychrotolerans]
MPVYNAENYLQRSISSVLSQSFRDFELIVINDGSTDNSLAIITGFDNTKIRLISQDNRGVSAARNLGIAMSRGQWVAFLDADDEWANGFLGSIFSAIGQYPASGVVYSMTATMMGSKIIHSRISKNKEPLAIDYFSFVLANGDEMNSSCAVIRRDVFDVAGVFPEGIKLGEDTDMWMRAAWITQVVHVPDVLVTVHADASGRKLMDFQEWVPYWVSTYNEWLHAGKIPPQQIKAALEYYQRFVFDRSLICAKKGLRLKACIGLRDVTKPIIVHKKVIIRTLAYIFLPKLMIESLRIIFK